MRGYTFRNQDTKIFFCTVSYQIPLSDTLIFRRQGGHPLSPRAKGGKRLTPLPSENEASFLIAVLEPFFRPIFDVTEKWITYFGRLFDDMSISSSPKSFVVVLPCVLDPRLYLTSFQCSKSFVNSLLKWCLCFPESSLNLFWRVSYPRSSPSFNTKVLAKIVVTTGHRFLPLCLVIINCYQVVILLILFNR